jgi:glycosyltransferase involved in cell wall biosynthesis
LKVERLNILHLLASPVWSGPMDNVALLAAAQAGLGHRVQVAIDGLRGGLGSEEPAAPRLAAAGLGSELKLELSTKSTPWGLYRDARSLRAADVDVIHCHFSHDHWLARWAKPKRAKVVRSIHAPRSLRPSMPRADAFTVPFEALQKELPQAPSWVWPAMSGAAFRPASDRAAVRKMLGIGEGPLIGMVSTFQASRRHDVAIEAMAQVHERRPEARLVLLGDGEREAQMRAQVAEQGLQDVVRFAGYQRAEALVCWLQAVDEVWVLGLGNDFSGRAALQARGCGARVLAVDEGALDAWADVIVEPTAASVSSAALGSSRRARPLPASAEVAKAMVALYEKALK